MVAPSIRCAGIGDLAAMTDHSDDDALRAIDALQPEHVFIMASDDDPKPVLRRLQSDRPRQFEWSVLEAGPARYRIEIRRRAAAGSRDVSEYLGGDHQRLADILTEVTRLVGDGARADAARLFAEFACGLNWHIDAEEITLFPAFEQKTGILEGPTTVLRDDHRQIRRRMAEVADHLKAGDAAAAGRAITALDDILGEHNIMEEQVLYPMTDQAMVDRQERDDLVKRIQIT
ncbi:MAG: hemerythrin domain-containing protein [Acidobacteriota bacterium]|nr:hemerythrin domain-containing protein [Acidobacteriota bacterium]